MNPRYFELPIDKQKNLINAGYKLFAMHPYKKASLISIADEAGISKSLLFYYFKNKKEYYLFLFDHAIEFTNEKKVESIYKKKCDLFELVNQTIERRIKMLHDYPYLYRFITRAYYETSEEVKFELVSKKRRMTQVGKEEILALVDRDKFKNPRDAEILIDIILYTAEGCMRNREDLDIIKTQEIIKEYQYMMKSLQKNYYKEAYFLNQLEV